MSKQLYPKHLPDPQHVVNVHIEAGLIKEIKQVLAYWDKAFILPAPLDLSQLPATNTAPKVYQAKVSHAQDTADITASVWRRALHERDVEALLHVQAKYLRVYEAIPAELQQSPAGQIIAAFGQLAISYDMFKPAPVGMTEDQLDALARMEHPVPELAHA